MLRQIIRENWTHRGQTWFLAVTELRKSVHGARLGWVWLILKPAVYVAAFWFTLAVGLRVVHDQENGASFLVWLATGIFVWQYISAMLVSGSNVYKRYSYLVIRLKFPLSVISSFHSLGQLIIFLITQVLLVVIMVLTRTPMTIYLIQWPAIVLLLHVTFTAYSLATSPLSAISADFHNAIKVSSTPLFWLSGIIFDVSKIDIVWLRWIFAFNPVTFFAEALRASTVNQVWVWSDPMLVYPFLIVLAVLVVFALRVQSRLGSEVADVL